MKKPFIVAAAAALFFPGLALAQVALTGAGRPTPAADAIALGPLVDALSPLVNAAVSGAVIGIGGLVFAFIARLTGIAFTPDDQAAIEKAADGAVQVEIARAENNLATGKFEVRSPLVRALAVAVATDAPKIVKRLGLAPGDVEREVVKAIGRAQMKMTNATPPIVPKGA